MFEVTADLYINDHHIAEAQLTFDQPSQTLTVRVDSVEDLEGHPSARSLAAGIAANVSAQLGITPRLIVDGDEFDVVSLLAAA